jgi:hypothetical protein
MIYSQQQLRSFDSFLSGVAASFGIHGAPLEHVLPNELLVVAGVYRWLLANPYSLDFVHVLHNRRFFDPADHLMQGISVYG